MQIEDCPRFAIVYKPYGGLVNKFKYNQEGQRDILDLHHIQTCVRSVYKRHNGVACLDVTWAQFHGAAKHTFFPANVALAHFTETVTVSMAKSMLASEAGFA